MVGKWLKSNDVVLKFCLRLLDTNLLIHMITFFNRCQSLKEQHTNLKPERRRQFILFMGDLFLHFGIYVGEHKQRILLLGFAVIELLTTLLNPENRKDKDNLKCVSQTLKVRPFSKSFGIASKK